MENEQLVQLTADIVAAHVANNNVAVGDVGNLVQRIYEALAGLEKPADSGQAAEKTPVVSVRASIKPEYIVCMECGAKQRMLKRHLMTAHKMTPDQYRTDYGLPREYPMVAPNYSEQRRTLAHAIGLGRKKEGAAPSAGGESAAPAAKSGRGRGRPRKNAQEG
jgi:predicted transcriptional regulator